jgi:hypothetical protein
MARRFTATIIMAAAVSTPPHTSHSIQGETLGVIPLSLCLFNNTQHHIISKEASSKCPVAQTWSSWKLQVAGQDANP